MPLVSPKTPLRRRLQWELMRLILLLLPLEFGMVLLDAALKIRERGGRALLVFTVIWMVLTLAIVLSSLHRIRVLRIQARRGALR